MPFEPKSLEGDVPAGAHLAILTDESGLFTAIPVGATVLLVEDPSRMDRVFPMILAKLSRTKMEFICGCGEQGCTRRYAYKLLGGGGHHVNRQTRTQQALDSGKS